MNTDKKTQYFMAGIFVLMVIILLYVIWYTSSIKIEADRAKPDYSSYDIEEGFNIMMNGVNEIKEVLAAYESELYYWKDQIDILYHQYYPKGSAQDVDSQFRAIRQRMSIASFFGEGEDDD